ncbi:Aat Leu/Phe-tRNA-protein transferase [Methylophilaceae bacterium]|jgi:leucyl/phenylalanyl-tRNA--protein transferase
MTHAYYQLPNGRVACIDGNCEFPTLSNALKEPNGLIAIGGDLSTPRLLNAYQQGIFPWFNEGDPIMWWSPNPRMVLFPNELKISASLKKTVKKQPFEIRFNTSFRSVITACSQAKRQGQPGTWINTEMINAYCNLFDAGHAICVEAWLDNQLVGGCYGVVIGHMFYGESMFHHVSEASKVAFVHLVAYLQKQDIAMIDCQMKTALLTQFGGREIPRTAFIQQLIELVEFKHDAR